MKIMDTGSYCRKTLKIETAKAELVTTEITARYSNKKPGQSQYGIIPAKSIKNQTFTATSP